MDSPSYEEGRGRDVLFMVEDFEYIHQKVIITFVVSGCLYFFYFLSYFFLSGG